MESSRSSEVHVSNEFLPNEESPANRRERRSQRPARVRLGKNRVLATGTLMGGALLSAASNHAAVADEVGTGTRLAQANTYQNGQTGPVVSLLQPGYASTLRGKVKILVGIQGRKYTPKTIELFVDGKSASGEAVELDASPSMEFNWDTTLFTDGPHRLGVKVVDVQGFAGVSETQVYINNGRKVDSTSPTLAWLNIREGAVLKGQVDLQLKANDDFGVKYIFVSINPAATPTRKPPLRQYLLNRPPYSFPFDTTRVPDGLYVLDALAWDALENEGKAEQRHFGVLNNPLNATLMDDLSKFGNTTPEAPASDAPAGSAASRFGAALPNTSAGTASANAPATGNPAASSGSRSAGNTSSGKATGGTGRVATGPGKTPKRGNAPLIAENPAVPSHAANTSPAAGPDLSLSELDVETAVSSGRSTAGAPAIDHASPGLTASLPEIAGGRRQTRLADAGGAAVHGKSSGSATAPVTSEAFSSSYEGSLASGTVVPAMQRPVEARATDPTGTLRVAAAPAPAKASAVDKNSPAVSLQTSVKPTAVSRFAKALPARSASNEGPRVAIPEIAMGSGKTGFGSTGVADRAGDSVFSLDGTLAGVSADSGASKIAVLGTPDIVRSNPTRLARLSDDQLTARPTGAGMAAGSRAAGFKVAGSSANVVQLPSFPAGAGALPGAAGKNVSGKNAATKKSAGQRVAALPPQMEMHRARPSITVARPVGKLPASYVAPKEEYLSAVAARFGISAQMLAAVNNVPVQTRLARGQQLNLPREIAVSYEGKPVTGDVASLMVGSTSLTAFRFLFEQQGGTMTWDAKNQRVTARNGKQEINLTIGSSKAMVNQKEVMMDMAAFLMSGRTMVPVRFFEKSMHAQIEWEPSTGRMLVSISGPSNVG